MNDHNQLRTTHTFKSRGRGCLLWLGRGLAALLGLALVGYIYESLAEAADARAYPPPGQLVDVGGYRLHINCTGSGNPTVVIVAGAGDWSTTWGGVVQPEVAKTTRVCTYDRPGLGWSEAGSLPSDAARFARELHALLQNANVPGPYVMVGHSLGGLGVRVFVHEYASEVAGVVLLESMNPKQISQLPSAERDQPNSPSRYYSVLTGLARFGVARVLARPVIQMISPSIIPDENAYYSR